MTDEGFAISIVAGPDVHSSSVSVHGRVQHVISDDERKTFGLKGDDLYKAVDKYLGKKPNHAFLHGPTHMSRKSNLSDLYKHFDWSEVHTVLAASSAKIVDITSEPIILKTQVFTNTSSVPARYTATITDSVTETTLSSWSTGGEFTISQEFKYNVSFLGTGGGGETDFSYTQSWGIGGEKSRSAAVGSSSGISVNLDPGQSVAAQLQASRGVMKVRVEYAARLTGQVAAHYDKAHKGHYYWALPVSGVLNSSNLSNSIKTTETIDIGYFSNSKVILTDNDSGKVMESVYTGHDIQSA